MLNHSYFIKAKVVLGYVILISITLFSVYTIHQEITNLSESDSYEIELTKRRKAVSNTLYELYEAEIIGQSLSAGRLSDYPLYRQAINRIQLSIDSLKVFATDSLQQLRMDSISMLLRQKESNTLSLLRTIREAESDKLYQENISRIIADQDSLLSQQRIQQKWVVKKDSFRVKPSQKKGFIKRLTEVFVPQKQDSSLIINTTRELVTDTLYQSYNPADTIAGIFRHIQTQVSDKQQEIYELVQQKNNVLRYNNRVLSAKISRIIRDFEQAELGRSLYKAKLQESIRQRSMHTVGLIATLSALLAAFFILLIWRDITKSNHYRRQLEIAKRRAEELLATREQLMLTITHDIKAPLSSIIGYTELLQRLTKEERQRFYLSNMQSSSDHLLRLVNDLLDFHRLDSNKMELNRVRFQPKQLFDEIAVSFRPIAEKKQIDLKYNIEENLNGHFISDPLRMRQIVNNLLSNAIKFTAKGEVTLKVHYLQPHIIIQVRDTGKGITNEDQQRIFQEFTRLPDAQGIEGFGLGLSITQKMIRLLEGTISVHSQINEGSNFIVSLPIYPIAGAIEEEPESSSNEVQRVMDETDHLLVIDDDLIQLTLTAAMLKSQGVDCTTCNDPNNVQHLLQENRYSLILTDVQMPAINGFELLEQLRLSDVSQAQTIPLVAVTARSEMNEQEFLDKGFVGCLHKPFSQQELIHIIRRVKLKPQTDLKLSTLTAFSEGDDEASAAIMETFLNETKKNREMMAQAFQAGDGKLVSAMAHKLLPLFTLIEATDCTPLLTYLEAHPEKEMNEETRKKTAQALEGIDKITTFVEHKENKS